MQVVTKTIPHSEQRYDTIGDWWWEGDTLHIRVTDMANWKYEMAVAYHEMREALYCKHFGISQESVDTFDINFDAEQKRGLHAPDAEPGNDPTAPYFLAHQYATRDERLFIADIGESWEEYEKVVLSYTQ